MPRMNKSNARDIMSQTLDQLCKITGETIGVCFTWQGSLSVLGPKEFSLKISQQTDEIWRSLYFSHNLNQEAASFKDEQMTELLRGDTGTYTTAVLRKLISWVTKKSVGRVRNFWGNADCKPEWWPSNIPFQCISNPEHTKKITESDRSYVFDNSSLITILHSYIASSDIPSKSIANSLKNNTTTTQINSDLKRSNSNNSSPISSTSKYFKQEKLDDSVCNTNECSFFDGLLDTPRSENSKITTNYIRASSTPLPTLDTIQATTFEPIQNMLPPSFKNKCINELAKMNSMLSDNSINAFCILLKKTFPDVSGLQDTLYSQNLGFTKATEKNYIQIHYNGARHWVCSSSSPTGEIFLFDSLYTGITDNLSTQLALIYANTNKLSISVARIQQQTGVSDCGLFALAVATTLASGLDPVLQSWDQALMREHCIKCIESENIKLFPGYTRGQRTGKLPQAQRVTLSFICDCNLPEFAHSHTCNKTVTRTIQCDQCYNWYHNRCYGLPDTSIAGEFNCNSCSMKK